MSSVPSPQKATWARAIFFGRRELAGQTLLRLQGGEAARPEPGELRGARGADGPDDWEHRLQRALVKERGSSRSGILWGKYEPALHAPVAKTERMDRVGDFRFKRARRDGSEKNESAQDLSVYRLVVM